MSVVKSIKITDSDGAPASFTHGEDDYPSGVVVAVEVDTNVVWLTAEDAEQLIAFLHVALADHRDGMSK